MSIFIKTLMMTFYLFFANDFIMIEIKVLFYILFDCFSMENNVIALYITKLKNYNQNLICMI